MADTDINGGSMNTLKGNAQAAYDSVTNGPVAQNVKEQSTKTSSEFSNLAGSRQRPAYPTATGQPLTHYHSFFSELLSWNNPRASAIAYLSIVTVIFAARYLDVIRYTLKLTWMALGVTLLAEVAGKTVLSNGLATQLRPRKYYTVSRDTIDAMFGDVHELINFFVIEAQRVFFAENIYASSAAAFGAFLSYFLVKIVPYWGLALIATTVTFLVPLVYTTNQELIDSYLQQANEVIYDQTAQLREVANKHTANATELTKQYVGDYTTKAQQMLGGRSVSGSSDTSPPVRSAPSINVMPKGSEFPQVPRDNLKNQASEDEDEEETDEEEVEHKRVHEPLVAV